MSSAGSYSNTCGHPGPTMIIYYHKDRSVTHFCSLECSLKSDAYKVAKTLEASPSLKQYRTLPTLQDK